MKRGAGFTLVEAVMAAGLFGATLAGSYAFFAAAARAGSTIDRYSGAMQALASIQARFEADLRAALVPELLDVRTTGMEVGAGGRSLALSRVERVRDLELAREDDEVSRRVTWALEAEAGTPPRLVRRVDGGETVRWAELEVQAVRFAIEPVDFDVFVAMELLVAVPAAPGAAAPVRTLPLRLVHRLVAPGRLTGPGRDWPEALLGPLPPETAAPP